jgi:hypothetical protein
MSPLSPLPPPPPSSQNTACSGYVIAVLRAFNIQIRLLIKYTVTLVFMYVSTTAPLL